MFLLCIPGKICLMYIRKAYSLSNSEAKNHMKNLRFDIIVRLLSYGQPYTSSMKNSIMSLWHTWDDYHTLCREYP